MIPPFPKPHPLVYRSFPVPKPVRLPKRERMTIGIGMMCHGGVVIAADGQVSYPDGSKTRGRKVCKANAAHITFGIAQSTEDSNVSEGLVNEISAGLSNPEEINSWKGFETAVKSKMTEWHGAYGAISPPSIQLIIGAAIPSLGARLYYCQPPNTAIQKTGGYVSIGSGAAVADTLFTLLFSPAFKTQNIQVVLHEIAYLMYRAKGIEGNAWCGGPTDAVYLDSTTARTEWIYSGDFKIAEEAAFQLDAILNQTSLITLTQTNDFLDQNPTAVIDMIRTCEKFRQVIFHDLGGKPLGNPNFLLDTTCAK